MITKQKTVLSVVVVRKYSSSQPVASFKARVRFKISAEVNFGKDASAAYVHT